MLNYKKPKHTTEPKLYVIALHAQNQGQVLVWNTAVAAYSTETARTEALDQLEKQDLRLYQEGRALGGWNIQAHIELSPAKIDELLLAAYHQYDVIHAEKERREVNDLMATIVETASRKLLNKYRDRFTSAEVAYLENEIAAYERKA